MSAWAGIRERLRALLFRESEDRELDEELRFHLAKETEKNVRAGLDPTEARRRAMIAFGGVERYSEQVREARGTLWLENSLRDLRHAARGLRRNPLFTVTAVVTLALGIGATTTVFALANGLLIRPLPGIAAQKDLFVVRMEEAPGLGTGISRANIERLQAGAPALAGLVGHQRVGLQALAPDGSAVDIEGAVVQGDYFSVLGARPLLGRWFTEDERAPSAAGDVAVVSERFWATHLQRAPDAIGKVIRLNAEAYRVIGVAPRGFQGVQRLEAEDVWLPVAAYPRAWHLRLDPAGAKIFMELIGRLQPGATFALAEDQLLAGARGLVELDPDENGTYAGNVPTIYPGIGLEFLSREGTSRTVRLLLGLVSILLLIACANVANLLVSRALTRHAEASIRRVMGASRGRVLRQQLTEGLLLSLLGAVGGVIIAFFLRLSLEGQGLLGLPVMERVPLDSRVLGFAVACALLTGALATGLAAWFSTRADLLSAVRSSERSSTSRGAVMRGALTTVQIAASLTLLVGALLLVRTTSNLARVDLGFEPEGVMLFGYDPAPQAYGAERYREIEREVLERLRALPGVQRVSVSMGAPSFGSVTRLMVSVPGSAREGVQLRAFAVSADYFRVLGIPMLAGRAFSSSEEFSPESGVVLSASAAQALFGRTDVVGASVETRGFDRVSKQLNVIGVTADFRPTGVRGGPAEVVHLPLGAGPMNVAQAARIVLVRSSLPQTQLTEMVQEAFRGIDPSIPFFRVEPLSQGVSRSIREERLMARLMSLFALLAAALAAVGLYGVVAYSVARRQREIGIRMSLGATRRAVVGLVAGQSMRLLAVGSVFGVAGGYALSRVLSGRLFGVSPLDPAVYVSAVAGFALVALAASALPARRAARLDPVSTLKAE